MVQEIINAFERFFYQNGKLYSEFYVGIAIDPNDRLISGHGAQHTPNIYWNIPLESETIRTIEKFFLDKGVLGGPGGGDNNTCYIYAYKISANTRQ